MVMMSGYSEYQCACHTTHVVITQSGWSALMEAARGGKTEVVVELVKAGANVDMQDNVCQYIYMYMTHDVNVQNHTGRLNSPLFVTHTCTCIYFPGCAYR